VNYLIDTLPNASYNGLDLVKDEFMLPDKNPQIDEAVWQAWLKKNKAQDRFRYERRLRVMALVAVFGAVSALLWKFVG
jgi:hypothetical protein